MADLDITQSDGVFVAVCLLIPLLADSIKGFLREFRGSGSLSAGATEVRQQVAILSCGDPPKWLRPPFTDSVVVL